MGFFSYDSELEKVIRDIVDWFPVLKDQLEIKDVEDHKDIVFKKEAIKNADFLKKGIIRSIKQKLGTTKSIMMDERFGQAIEICKSMEQLGLLSVKAIYYAQPQRNLRWTVFLMERGPRRFWWTTNDKNREWNGSSWSIFTCQIPT